MRMRPSFGGYSSGAGVEVPEQKAEGQVCSTTRRSVRFGSITLGLLFAIRRRLHKPRAARSFLFHLRQPPPTSAVAAHSGSGTHGACLTCCTEIAPYTG